jgi:hypothetical protein
MRDQNQPFNHAQEALRYGRTAAAKARDGKPVQAGTFATLAAHEANKALGAQSYRVHLIRLRHDAAQGAA